MLLVISNENSVLQISISLLRIRLIFICSFNCTKYLID
jgi:hypothetical protein